MHHIMFIELQRLLDLSLEKLSLSERERNSVVTDERGESVVDGKKRRRTNL